MKRFETTRERTAPSSFDYDHKGNRALHIGMEIVEMSTGRSLWACNMPTG